MSHLIAGIDESLRPRNYPMCATVASTNDRAHVRQVLRGLLLPNQRRLHAKTESQGRRRRILKALSERRTASSATSRSAGCGGKVVVRPASPC